MSFSNDKSQLDSQLKCPKCLNEFNDPRFLPCGDSACNSCIISFLNDKQNDFNCFICNESHSVPINGFAISKTIAKIIKLKNENSNSNLALSKQSLNDFSIKMDVIKSTINELEQMMTNKKSIIEEYFNFIRNDIELATESVVSSIYQQSSQLEQQINEIEKEIISINDSNYELHFNNFIKDTTEIFNDYQAKLSALNWDNDKSLHNDTIIIAQHLNRIKEEVCEVKNQLFNSKRFKFNQNEEFLSGMSPLNIGSIQSLLIKSLKFSQFDIINSSDVSTDTHDLVKCSKCSIICENGYFLLTFNCLKNNYPQNTVILYDSFNDVIKSSVNFLLNIYSLCEYNNTIVFSLPKSLKIQNTKDLGKSMKSINLKNCLFYKSLYADSLNIIGLNNNNKVDIYDWQLKLTQTIGQTKNSNEAFYFKDILQISYRNGRFICRCDNGNIKIINQIDGVALNTIKIDSYHFFINSMHQIVAFCDNFIKYYSLNGDLVEIVDLYGFPLNETFILDQKGNVNLLINIKSDQFYYNNKNKNK
jgi:hypothetical protein